VTSNVFLAAFDNKHTLAIEARLKTLKVPTLIVWGTDDVYFDVKWSRWLADTIPGTRSRVELAGARIFFPEERWRSSTGSCALSGWRRSRDEARRGNAQPIASIGMTRKHTEQAHPPNEVKGV
jgi:pimeloyl-ACP methyl ester carboxylesterase